MFATGFGVMFTPYLWLRWLLFIISCSFGVKLFYDFYYFFDNTSRIYTWIASLPNDNPCIQQSHSSNLIIISGLRIWTIFTCNIYIKKKHIIIFYITV
jgi:hypothetical protein